MINDRPPADDGQESDENAQTFCPNDLIYGYPVADQTGHQEAK